ncbi:MAG: hypothetical protein IJD59_08520 [Clostridia bacterium]|nr:hypothetical protein [Clostridia bacterium]
MEKFCKIVRMLTLAPVLAAFSITMIGLFCPGVFPTVWHFAYMILYLGVLPLLAYPLQSVTPHFKDKGRDGQRTLAMLYAVAGYIFCLITNLLASASRGMWIICLEYLLSGILILVFNKGLHIKLSAHGCGSAGPIFLLLYFGLYVPAVLMSVVTVFAYVASVKAKHHTVPQLVGGSAVSVLLLMCLACIL